MLAYRRGEHQVALDAASEERPAPVSGEVVLETQPGALEGGTLAPNSGAITMGLHPWERG